MFPINGCSCMAHQPSHFSIRRSIHPLHPPSPSLLSVFLPTIAFASSGTRTLGDSRGPRKPIEIEKKKNKMMKSKSNKHRRRGKRRRRRKKTTAERRKRMKDDEGRRRRRSMEGKGVEDRERFAIVPPPAEELLHPVSPIPILTSIFIFILPSIFLLHSPPPTHPSPSFRPPHCFVLTT